jgi:excinuclease ABC subunit B
MYADSTTDSMKLAMGEVTRRREIQRAYNEAHGITPTQVKRAIMDMSQFMYVADASELPLAAEGASALLSKGEIAELIKKTEKQMIALADEMEFEKAALERDRLVILREMDLGVRPALRTLLAEPTEKTSQRKQQPRKYRRKK